MLPPMLEKIKQNLEQKSRYQRSEEEDALLLELSYLDRSPETERVIQEGQRDRVFKIVSGPGPCPCCGR